MPKKAKIPGCHPDRKHFGHGLCASCYERTPERRKHSRDSQKAMRLRNPEKYRALRKAAYWKQRDLNIERMNRWRLQKVYGITKEIYDRMFVEQAGVCAICKKPSPNKRRLSVDHCHLTGKVRGLLCVPCNHNVGVLEGPKLDATRAYLETHT